MRPPDQPPQRADRPGLGRVGLLAPAAEALPRGQGARVLPGATRRRARPRPRPPRPRRCGAGARRGAPRPRARKVAESAHATWKPETSASAWSACVGAWPSDESSSVVRLVANVERSARPSAPPICCDVLKRPDASPASSAGIPLVAISVIGTKTSPMPMDARRIPGSRSVRYELSGVRRRKREQAGRAEREPDQGHLAGAERRNEPLRESGADDDPGGERDEREPRLERREPEHALHVERVEEEHREEAGGDHEHRHVRAAHRLHREDREPDERLGRAPLDQHECDEQHGREREEAEHLGGAPARLGRADDPVDERDQAAGHRGGPGEVEAPVDMLVLRLGDEAEREDEGDDSDRDVDEEDPRPGEHCRRGARRARGRRRRRRPRSPPTRRGPSSARRPP